MKVSSPLFVMVVAIAMLHVVGDHAAAQVELSATGNVISTRGASFGIGGRLGVPVRETFDMGIRIEGAVDYYWPSCSNRDCSLLASHLDVVFQQGFGGQGLGYFGAGATYEDYSVVENGSYLDDTGWGANLVIGSRTQTRDVFRPFVEVRFIMIGELRNQFTFSVGGAFVLGA